MEIFGHRIDLSLDNPSIAVRLGQFLIEKNLLRPEDLEQARNLQAQEQRDAHLPFGVLLSRYTAMAADRLEALLHHPGLQKTAMSLALSTDLVDQGRIETCLRLKPVGVGLGRVLQQRHPAAWEQIERLLMDRPELGELAFRTGLISREELTKVNTIRSGRRTLADVLSELNLVEKDALARTRDLHLPDLIAEQAAEILFKEAIGQGARTIHLDQGDRGMRLGLRIGHQYRQALLDVPPGRAHQTARALARHIKNLAGLSQATGALPGSGSLNLKVGTDESPSKPSLRGHVAVCPTRCGESITLQLTQPSGYGCQLDDLPYSPGILKDFKKLLECRQGLILICGPAGSGKRATLYAALRYLRHRYGGKIFSVENPVAHPLEGINQTQADPSLGLNQVGLLQAIARQDADILAVDDLEDGTAAATALEIAAQGCLVLGALAAGDAVAAIERLTALDLDRERIGTGLIGILAQRNLPRICKACKQPALPAREEWELLFDGNPDPGRFYAGEGCPVCDHSGFHGTTLIAELLELTPQTALSIRNGTDRDALAALFRIQGMRTLLEDGLDKIDQIRLTDLVRTVPFSMIQGFAKKEKPPAFAAVEQEPAQLLRTEERVSLDLHTPKQQGEAIDQLFSSYQAMRQKAGQTPVAADTELFRRFIVQSAREVKLRYACQAVRIDLIGSEDGVEILAVPVGVS